MARLSVIIPAAGLATRMNGVPKALVKVSKGETVINRQIRIIRDRLPCSQIVVVTGHENKLVEDQLPRNVDIVYNKEYEKSNVGYSIAAGLNAVRLGNSVLVVYGDLVFNENFFDGLDRKINCAFLDHSEYRKHEVGLTVVDGNATNFSFGLPSRWAQSIHLLPFAISYFRTLATHHEKRRWFGYEILNVMLEVGIDIKAVISHGAKLVEVDSVADVENAKRIR